MRLELIRMLDGEPSDELIRELNYTQSAVLERTPDGRYGLYRRVKEDSDTIPERIAELKLFLSDTDWVVIKIHEAALTSAESAEALKRVYSDVLMDRMVWREEINRLQSRLG